MIWHKYWRSSFIAILCSIDLLPFCGFMWKKQPYFECIRKKKVITASLAKPWGMIKKKKVQRLPDTGTCRVFLIFSFAFEHRKSKYFSLINNVNFLLAYEESSHKNQPEFLLTCDSVATKLPSSWVCAIEDPLVSQTNWTRLLYAT